MVTQFIYRPLVYLCDCAPKVADLFLHWYEHDYISKGIARSNPIVHKLKYCSRYIDDLNIPNATTEVCEAVCKDIYPAELDIVGTNSCPKQSNFLDLNISVESNSFYTKLYDKRRDFKFKVVSFPNLKSNVPSTPSYGVFTGELYRISKSSSKVEHFIGDVKLLLKKLINQNFNRNILYHKLSMFLKSKPACLNKFWFNFNMSIFKL